MKPHWSYAALLAALRIYAGAFWLAHGIPKFLNSGSFMPPNGIISTIVTHAAQSQGGVYHAFLASVVLPHIMLFAQLDRLGEVLTGCSLLLGFFTRAGGLVGALLALNYAAALGDFSTWTSIGSLDAAAFVLSFATVIMPAGRIAGVDGLVLRARRANAPPPLIPEVVEEPPGGTAQAPPR
jgi:uncharacterized membrane protein YphA (DoxX/SURF4 family)